MKTLLLINLLIFLSGMISCTHLKDRNVDEFKVWGYQLQGYNSPYDYRRIYETQNTLWVIDRDYKDRKVDSSKIMRLKENGNLIISYFSIGEAEDYRDYYKNMPRDLVEHENKNWEGNFKVKYWDSRWHKIMLRYLDGILDSGFDGVYLDIVDAFDYYPEEMKKQRANQMQGLIALISKHAKRKNPQFKIIQQNGSSIIHYLDDPTKWYSLIDGLAIESMFFSGSKAMNNAFKLDDSIMSTLGSYRDQNIPIFSVEYISDDALIKKYAQLAKEYKVIPLTSDRELMGSLKFSSEIFSN
ncbi:MAG: hypothetical protein CME60_08990 [Halobacteriovoraceae bacterium]|nr:hypothetical protein [Halobacteriovoraceae bacterium]